MIKLLLTFLAILLFMNEISAQDFPLYPGEIPNSKAIPNEEIAVENDGKISISNISIPTIRYYPAQEKISTGTAVIIFPGGSYTTNSFTHEGVDVAKKFNEIGITAFVVKYRIPNDATMLKKEIGPLQDAQQAIKLVREQAKKYKIKSDRIGVVGFSAGGHLASTAGTHLKESYITNDKNTKLKPDFMILIYPVISFQSDICNQRSRDQLIGENLTQEKIDQYSNELQISDETPPSFLVHAGDDSVVHVANSVRFYESLLKHKVPSEMHLYQRGEHGFGMNNKTTKDDWFQRCKNWMDSNGWLSK